MIDAIKTFEEFDPDESDTGWLSRVCYVFVKFGQTASDAVRPLISYLNDEPDDLYTCILDALVAIGPAAALAIPTLQKLRESESSAISEIALHPVERIDDPLIWAIQQIEAASKGCAVKDLWQ